MGVIRTPANSTFRDYVIDGSPSSGVHEPLKSDIRDLFGTVEDRVDTVVDTVAAVTAEGVAQVALVAAEGASYLGDIANAVAAIDYPTNAKALSNGVASVAITAAGTGGTTGTYTWTTTGGGGTNASGYLTIAGGAITAVVVEKRGYNYTTAPTIVIAGTPAVTGHTLTPSLSINQPVGSFWRIKVTLGWDVYENVAGVATYRGTYSDQAEVYGALDSIDLAGDRFSPWFINTWDFTKSGITANPTVDTDVAVVTRDSDLQLTVAAGTGAKFVAYSAVCIEDSVTGKVTSQMVKTVSGDVLTFYVTLPTNPSRIQSMHDSYLGQHLSRKGWNGLADYILDQTRRASYRKEVLSEYHAPTCKSLAYNQPDIYALDGVTKLFTVTPLNGAIGGGYVTGTTDLGKACSSDALDVSITNYTPGFLKRAYSIVDGVSGRGIRFTMPVKRRAGFLELAFAGTPTSYVSSTDGLTYQCDGPYKVKVTTDAGTILHEVTYATGEAFYPKIAFSDALSLDVEITLTTSAPTAVRLFSAYAYSKSASTLTTTLFDDGDVVAFLGDSWTQYPAPVGSETALLRPDGSSSGGMQFLSERIRTRLAAQGIRINTLNVGFGGQTSEWGKYWLPRSVLTLSPRPNKCVVLFGINDNNSTGAYAADTDSAYDYSPTSQYTNVVKSAGGLKGSVSYALWFANIQAICERLARAGIQPIVMMPGHTASGGQTQTIRNEELGLIARGFRA